jgi:hypothetical protein
MGLFSEKPFNTDGSLSPLVLKLLCVNLQGEGDILVSETIRNHLQVDATSNQDAGV